MAVCKILSPLQSNLTISLALFDNVTNCHDLKQMAMKNEIDAALLKPAMVLDQFQVLTAATKAQHLHQLNKKVTKTLHSEVLFSLTPSKNISDAFRKFGTDSKDTQILIVELSEGNSKMDEIIGKVKGTLVNIDKLADMADSILIKKTYKVKEAELQVGTLLEAVVSRMASKDFVSY